MNEIGERIRLRRKELNITQAKIYQEIGISSGNLSGIEAGKSLPSASALIGLSKILNCSIDWILTGENIISDSFFNNREKELLNNFRKLSDDDQEEILEIILLKLKRKNILPPTSYTSIGENEKTTTKIS